MIPRRGYPLWQWEQHPIREHLSRLPKTGRVASQERRDVPRNYWLSVRLQDAQGQTLAARDIPPFLGSYPTSLWKPGEVLT
ncbi:MAG: hypothetical protein J7M15_03445, partial [Anaerolineae bacterium]|nr:hypothetical protein [Anaerolineae bacterium]